jgi:hypothetical protein
MSDLEAETLKEAAEADEEGVVEIEGLGDNCAEDHEDHICLMSR